MSFFLVAYAAYADQVNDFAFTNFTNGALSGTAGVSSDGSLVMSSNYNNPPQTGTTAWYPNQVQVRGFETNFTYTISNNTGNPNQRPDGIAFVIQNSGISASGTVASGLGYGAAAGNSAGIKFSVAVEFDSWYNKELNDPDMFHIGVHSNGPNNNDANESFRIGDPYKNSRVVLGKQDVTIDYDPIQAGGTITVVFNDQPPLVVTGVSLQTLCGLEELEGNAFIGFTAGSHSQGSVPVETITVTNWSFKFLGHFDASNTLVSGISTVVAGEGLTFSVQAVDQYNYSMIIDGVGNGYLSATLTQPNGNSQTVNATYSGMGKYLFSINATISGDATVLVNFNGNIPVGSGSYPLMITASGPYAPLSYPFGFDSSTSVAGVPETFFVQLRDGFGNNITTPVSQSVTAIIKSQSSSYSLSVPGTYERSSNCYSITYNVTLAGNFTIEVQIDGTDTSNSILPLEVVPAQVYAQASVLYGASATTIAGETQYAYVQLKDRFGNNATSSDVTIDVTLSQHLTVVNGSVVGCVQGLCQISYTLTAASYDPEGYNLIVNVNGAAVLNSFSTTVNVSPAQLSPLVSYAYGQGVTNGVAGELTFFTVQFTDAYGNNASVSAPLTVMLQFDQQTITPTSYASSAGTYTFVYNATVATTYTLTVLVQNVTISNSPSNVTIVPNDVYPPNCFAFGDGSTGDLTVGTIHQFSIQLQDAFQNNITINGTEDLQATMVTDGLQVNATVWFDEGLYHVAYNITFASNYILNITINDIPILNSGQTITLAPGSIYPLTSLASSIQTSVTAGGLNSFAVQLRDIYSNDITTVPNPDGIVAATLTMGGVVVPVTVSYNGAGQYGLVYNATVSGSYTLTILVNSVQISGGIYQVEVAPGAAYPPLCLVEGNNLTSTVAGNAGYFVVYLFDAFNNSITTPGEFDALNITIGQENITTMFNSSIPAYVVTYNITKALKYDLLVVINGSIVVDLQLAVDAAPLYIPNCVADGPNLNTYQAGSAGTFTVYLRDVFGNQLPDNDDVQLINVTTALNGVGMRLLPTANGDGSYTINYNITVAGYYNTTIAINQGAIMGSPFTTNVAADQFDPHGTVTQNLQTTITAGDLNSFTIQLKDIWGNNVLDTNAPNPITASNISVQFNNQSVTPITVINQGEGVFLISYNYTTAGTSFMTVTIDGIEIGTSPPGNVVVQASSLYPPLCTASGAGITTTIVKQTTYFNVIVRDVYNNVRQWAPVQPVITLSANGKTFFGTPTDQDDGSYAISYYVETKAVYSVSVTFAGEHIQGSPFTVTANYGSHSTDTVLIVCVVVGCVVVLGGLIGAFVWYKRRRAPYRAILE